MRPRDKSIHYWPRYIRSDLRIANHFFGTFYSPSDSYTPPLALFLGLQLEKGRIVLLSWSLDVRIRHLAGRIVARRELLRMKY